LGGLGGGNRLKLLGCSLKLKTQAAQMLGIALHELATNAVKYGPLGDAGGHVQLEWVLADSEEGHRSLSIDWIEHTSNPVPTRHRPGFGSHILEDAVADTTNGHATFEITPRGARWSLRVPDVSLIIAA